MLIQIHDLLGAKAPLELANLVSVSVSVHRHKKVSEMQDLARPSYIRYLPICKDLSVLLSPTVCVGVCTRKTSSVSTSVPI